MRSKNTGLPDALAEQLVGIVRGLRELDLRKAPSISETIDWARTLAVLGVDELSAQVLSDTVSVVVKYDKDVRKALDAIPRLVDPNAEVPERTGTAMGTATAWARTTSINYPVTIGRACGRRSSRRGGTRAVHGRPRIGTGRFTDGYYGTPTKRFTRPTQGALGSDVEAYGDRCTGSCGCCASAACASRSPRRSTRWRCAREPGVLADKALPTALRVALIKDRRDEEVFDEIFDAFFALVKVGGPRPRPRPRARPRGPLRHRRARGLHAVRGAERDPAAGPQPRQAGRHPRLLRPRGPRPAVQPAPGGQQDRPGGDDRRDRALKGQPGHPGLRATGCRSRPTACTARASPGQISQQQGTKVDADLSIAEQEALLGWLNDVEDEAGGHRGRRGGAAPPAHRRPRRAARGDQAPPRGAARAGARIVESSERAVAEVDRVGEHERMELEESLRRLRGRCTAG